MGKQLGRADKSAKTLAVYCADVRAAFKARRLDLCLQEWTSRADNSTLDEGIGDASDGVHRVSIVTQPLRRGWGMTRQRSCNVIVNMETAVWVGPPQGEVQADFESFFDSVGNGASLANAFFDAVPESAQFAFAKALGKNRGKHLPSSGIARDALPWAEVVPPGCATNLRHRRCEHSS